MIGFKFHYWTVVRKAPDKKYEKMWYCVCDCSPDEEKIVYERHLKSGNSKSCGCLKDEVHRKRLRKYNKYDLTGEFGLGYTVKNEKFYFDLEDYDKIKDEYWMLHNGYIITRKRVKNGKSIITKMHTHVLNTNAEVDHINKIKHDNRKENLRTCAHIDNSRNVGIKKNNTSGIIGVSYISRERKKRWYAYININYKMKSLGYYSTKEEAIKVRLEAEKKYFGEFAPQQHLFEQYNIA